MYAAGSLGKSLACQVAPPVMVKCPFIVLSPIREMAVLFTPRHFLHQLFTLTYKESLSCRDRTNRCKLHPMLLDFLNPLKPPKGNLSKKELRERERKSIRAKGKLATIALALVFLAVVAVGFAQKESLLWIGAAGGEAMGLIVAFVLLKWGGSAAMRLLAFLTNYGVAIFLVMLAISTGFSFLWKSPFLGFGVALVPYFFFFGQYAVILWLKQKIEL